MSRQSRRHYIVFLARLGLVALVLFLIEEAPRFFILMLSLSLGAAAVLWIIERICRKRLSKPGCCPSCGYNLTGNISGVCPECGMPFEIYARSGRNVNTREIRPLR